jgi:hypothetical protein
MQYSIAAVLSPSWLAFSKLLVNWGKNSGAIMGLSLSREESHGLRNDRLREVFCLANLNADDFAPGPRPRRLI